QDPAHGKDEQVDCIGNQRKPDHELIGTRALDQPDPRPGKYPDRGGEHQFHQAGSFSGSGRTVSISCRAAGRERTRSDWWAIAISISTVAPTTRLNTPMSKISAEAVGTSPISGISVYW